MRRLIEHLDVAFTVDKNDTILRDASVVIENDRIADIGSAADIASRHKGSKFDETIDGRMKAICPGFVDSHVHLGAIEVPEKPGMGIDVDEKKIEKYRVRD